MGGLSSLVWKYILTGFPGYLREGEGVGCKLRHPLLYFPPLSPLIISIAFAFLFNRSISITIIYHLTNLLIMAPGAFTNSISLRV